MILIIARDDRGWGGRVSRFRYLNRCDEELKAGTNMDVLAIAYQIGVTHPITYALIQTSLPLNRVVGH